MTHDFIIGPTDTDSISFSKADMSPFSKEEIDGLISELNGISPEFMIWANDGYYDKCLVVKAKNYILINNGKRTVRGSAFKDSKKSPLLKEFMMEIVQSLLDEKGHEDLISIYNRYCITCFGIKDIKPWCKKVTITDKITRCKGHTELTKEEKKTNKIRANESKVYDAVMHKNVQEGDKVYLYFKKDKSLGLLEEFTGEYDEFKLVASIHSTLKTFMNVLDFDKFPKYNLKKQQQGLLDLVELQGMDWLTGDEQNEGRFNEK